MSIHAKQEGVEAHDGAEASRSNQQEKPEEPTMPAVPPATEPAPTESDVPDKQGRARKDVTLRLLTMDSAPRDGRRFVHVKIVTTVGGGKEPYKTAYAIEMRRERSSEDKSTPGFWMTTATSIPDLDASYGYWIPLWGADVLEGAPAIEDRAQRAAIRPAVEPAPLSMSMGAAWERRRILEAIPAEPSSAFFGWARYGNECVDFVSRLRAALAVPAVSPEMTPHLSHDELGNVVLEWWNGARKLTMYPADKTMLKSWGPHIETEMEDVPLEGKAGHHACKAAFAWLAVPAVSVPSKGDGWGGNGPQGEG